MVLEPFREAQAVGSVRGDGVSPEFAEATTAEIGPQQGDRVKS